MDNFALETLWRAYQDEMIEGVPPMKGDDPRIQPYNDLQNQFEKAHNIDNEASWELADITIPREVICEKQAFFDGFKLGARFALGIVEITGKGKK